MLLREKKYHESYLFQIQIMTLILINLGPEIYINSKSPHPWFSESVKIIRAQKKQKKTLLLFEIV